MTDRRPQPVPTVNSLDDIIHTSDQKNRLRVVSEPFSFDFLLISFDSLLFNVDTLLIVYTVCKTVHEKRNLVQYSTYDKSKGKVSTPFPQSLSTSPNTEENSQDTSSRVHRHRERESGRRTLCLYGVILIVNVSTDSSVVHRWFLSVVPDHH